jgi:hypothetical protein
MSVSTQPHNRHLPAHPAHPARPEHNAPKHTDDQRPVSAQPNKATTVGQHGQGVRPRASAAAAERALRRRPMRWQVQAQPQPQQTEPNVRKVACRTVRVASCGLQRRVRRMPLRDARGMCCCNGQDWASPCFRRRLAAVFARTTSGCCSHAVQLGLRVAQQLRRAPR